MNRDILILSLLASFFMISCGKETEYPSLSVSVDNGSRVIAINQNTIKVNLVATPKPLFALAEVESHIGDGWVIIKKGPGGLYVNDRKVILYLSKRQMNWGSLQGYDLREELIGKPILNANVLDALADNPHLIPEDWKKDENGNKRYVLFWATVYRDLSAHHHLYVRSLYFSDGVWNRGRILVSYYRGSNSPAALLESN